jgi:hypothetical protein
VRGVVVVVCWFALVQPARADEEEFPDPPLEIAASAVYAASTVRDLIPAEQTVPIEDSAQGVIVTAEVGYRVNQRSGLGGYVSAGWLWGTYARTVLNVEYTRVTYELIPIEIGAGFHHELVDQVWAGILVGAHIDGARFPSNTSWTGALGTGLEVAWDFEHVGDHWFALYGRANATFLSDIGFGAIGIGLGYHH